MRWKTRLLIAILSLLPSTVLAQLSVSLDDQDYLVLSAENLDLLAIELQSASSSLLISEDAAPFQGVFTSSGSTTNARQFALYYNLGTPITIDGDVTLATRWDSARRNDVLYQYGTLTHEEPLQPIVGHQRFIDTVSETPVIAEQGPGVVAGQEINIPVDDVNVTIPPFTPNDFIVASPTEHGFFFFDEQNVSVVSLTVRSEEGLLLPGGPSPLFDSLLSDTPFEITYASDTEVPLWGEFFVPGGWSGRDFRDLSYEFITADGEMLRVETDMARALPEPSSSGLILAGLVLLTINRRRR